MSASTSVRPEVATRPAGSGSSARGSSSLGAPPRRRRRWLRLVVAVLVLALLVGVGWLVGFSSVFAARQITVTGNDALSTEQVKAAAQIPLGLPLARQDTDAIADRVASLRPVSSVRVARRWPQTVVVTVQERTPVLAVAAGAGFELVDAGGTPYLGVSTVPKGVVVSTVDQGNSALLTELGIVTRALPADLLTKVRTIGASSADGITLELRDGDRVTWGGSDESVLKAQVLAALLEQSARTYDVSAPHNPTIR